MHVYLREDPVELEIRGVEADGLVSEESELIPVAFYVSGNESPSFRAILPAETVAVLEEATLLPVRLGLLAEEPEGPEGEVHAMVGLTLLLDDGDEELEGGDEEEESREGNPEPWRADADAWKSDIEEVDGGEGDRTMLLAFAPLVRLRRRFPDNFAEELADLLESALSGSTRPALEARVDDVLGDL